MELNLHASLLNVSNLKRSAEFYQYVFGLRPAARSDRVAALVIDEKEQRQVLLLREAGGPHPVHMGRGTIGPRLVALAARSPGDLDVIEQRLASRQALLGRRQTQAWEAVVGVDPDRIEVSVVASTTGGPIPIEEWCHLDRIVYELGE